MTPIDPMALPFVSLSGAIRIINPYENNFTSAGSIMPSKRRVQTRQSRVHEAPRNDQETSVKMWDVLLNSCSTACGEPEQEEWSGGRVYRSTEAKINRRNPMSPMSPSNSFIENYFDMLRRESNEGPLYKGRELLSTDSSRTWG
jgi:hypothetical protein